MSALDELRAAVGPDCRVIDEPDLMIGYRQDQTTIVAGAEPLAVILPRTTEDVVAAMTWATAHRIPVVPRGAGTSLAAGASASEGCLIVCTSRMTAIRELEPGDRLAVVEAGVITADVDRAARKEGLMFAPDPSSHEISTIGGNAATNAGGLRCVKYGVTRQSVLGLEVVLADGRILHTGGKTIKNVAGYDLTSLFVGSEGTLGIITAVTVKLLSVPPIDPITVVGGFPSLTTAGAAVSAIIAAGIQPSLLELLDRVTLAAIDEWKNMGLAGTGAMLIAQADSIDAAEVAQRIADLCEASGADSVAVSSDAAEASQLLEIRRLAYPAAERLGTCLVEDVGVPVSRLPEMIALIEEAAERHGVIVLTVAHAGDGNLHPTFVFDLVDGAVPQPVWDAADEIFAAALQFGGTITGEHGVGILKKDWLDTQLGETAMDITRAIKGAIDPLGLLNPGKVLS